MRKAGAAQIGNAIAIAEKGMDFTLASRHEIVGVEIADRPPVKGGPLAVPLARHRVA